MTDQPYAAPGPPHPPPGQQPGQNAGQQPVQPWNQHSGQQSGQHWNQQSGQQQWVQPPATPRRRARWLLPLLLIVGLGLASAGVTAALITVTKDDDAAASGSIDDLSTGDCLASAALRDAAGAESSVDDIETVDCTETHDAEVLMTFRVTAGQASGFDLSAAGAECAAQVSSAFTAEEISTIDVRPLTNDDTPTEGDKVACLIRHRDGSRLSAPLIK